MDGTFKLKAMTEIRLRIRLKHKETNEIVILYNDVFDARNGIAWYEIDRKQWELLSYDQFTGLKDKNGKDIYEGDILELVGGTCNYLQNGIYDYQRYILSDRVIVQKLLSGFTLAGLNMVDCETPNRVGKINNYTFWNHQYSFKIIGNIH